MQFVVPSHEREIDLNLQVVELSAQALDVRRNAGGHFLPHISHTGHCPDDQAEECPNEEDKYDEPGDHRLDAPVRPPGWPAT